MLCRRPAPVLLAIAVALSLAPPLQAAETVDVIRTIITTRSDPDAQWSSLNDVAADLDALYGENNFAPLWLHDGRPSPQAKVVGHEISNARDRGLRASDYDGPMLTTRIEQPQLDSDSAGRLDASLTVSLLRFLRHLSMGRVDPRKVGFGLDAPREQPDLREAVRRIARADDAKAEIASFDPPFPLYRRLEEALKHYRELETRSNLPSLPDSPVVHPGEHSPSLKTLRTRLRALGDLPEDAPVPKDQTLYDKATVEAMKVFQRRHGLDGDGVIGKGTWAALRVPLRERTAQIELAMERLRWLPRTSPGRFLIVNIPEFRLSAFDSESDGPVVSSKVVVGSAARRNETPILNADMQYVVLRPYWHVPPGILKKEILPKLKGDPQYLAKHGMEMIDGKVRQLPGEDNSLGLIKFIFPNRHHVYLHDTPSKDLFSRSRRDFSHGCIRVAKPIDLAEFVLRGVSDNDGAWTKERIVDAMQNGKNNRHVQLAAPIPVYLLYSTAIAGRAGEVRFFEDIYGHDAELLSALAKGPPYP